MARVNDGGTRYSIGQENLRLTADIPNGALGYVEMEELLKCGITDIGGANLDEVTSPGVYRYTTIGAGKANERAILIVAYKSGGSSPTSSISQTRFTTSGIQTRNGSTAQGLTTWEDWQELGGSPDAVLKNASNQVGDTFALTSQNKDGDITVSAGREATVNGGAKATVQGGTAEVKSTNGNATVQASQSVNVSTTNGDINLNPGGQGKAKVNGKDVAVKDDLPEGITDLGTVEEADLDSKTTPGVYRFATAPAVPPQTKEMLVVSESTGGASRVVTQVRFGQTVKTRSWKNSTEAWSAWTEIGGGSSVKVVQTTGQSTTSVMSQKAVTNTIGNLSSDVNRDEGLYEDVDTLGETVSRTSTNGEPVSYINHRIEEYEVSTDDPTIFTYDEQVHTLKLAQFTVHPQEGDLNFIADNNRGVLLDPTWSYVNFICSNEPRYFSARIGGGKCVLVDTNGYTSGDHYIQLFAEAAYSASTGNIEVSIFAEYKLDTNGAENNPLYINNNLPGYLRIWIV